MIFEIVNTTTHTAYRYALRLHDIEDAWKYISYSKKDAGSMYSYLKWVENRKVVLDALKNAIPTVTNTHWLFIYRNFITYQGKNAK